MSESLVVAGLALHELWISFRLLATIAVLAGAGLVAVVVRIAMPLAAPLPWLAGALGLAAAFVAATAAWSFSGERRRGAAAWLVSRSVPRGSILIGWLMALAVPLAVSLVPVGALGLMTLPSLDLGSYVGALGAGFADLLVALCTGLLLGTLLGRVPAAAVAILLVAGVGAAAVADVAAALPLPGDGLRLLADLQSRERALGPALNAAGTSLIAAAVLTSVARLAVERSEL